MAMVFGVLSLIFSLIGLVGGIWILVEAFKMDITQGFLTLCVPCYIFYFMFAKLQSPQKNTMITIYFVGLIGNIIFQILAGVTAPAPAFPTMRM